MKRLFYVSYDYIANLTSIDRFLYLILELIDIFRLQILNSVIYMFHV